MSEQPTRMVHCQKLNAEKPGLKRPPVPGELGKRIYQNISQEAWNEWKKRQTMFINEYRLNLTECEARQFLQDQMQAFLFEDQDIKPEGFSAESQ
jgi:Fe-S cluster biosynthesis and repair protein YggX